MKLDKQNCNTLWRNAEETELNQIDKYDTFTDLGKGAKAPQRYSKVRVHMVYDVKHDGRRKARLVAGGHLTPPPTESTYSGVVSIRSLRLVLFAAELNGLEVHAADVGNAYLESKTKEKLYLVAGDEFGERSGHTLLVFKALYGLRSSGLRWHERFADTLRDMGFKPSKADPDVWMRQNGDHYEYIAVYVDDLAIAAKNAKAITDTLINKYQYKLKGVGRITYHLGCDFVRDPDGTLSFGPRKYVEKMMTSYEQLFGEKPRK